VEAALFPHLETPALLIERRILLKNIEDMQRLARDNRVALRPHAKTHKSPSIARSQLDRGAIGLTVATVTEAETMVDAGIVDIFLAYPPIGSWRTHRIGALLDRARIIVGLDSAEAVRALSRLSSEVGAVISYRWEVDSGLGRLGTPPGKPTIDAILEVRRVPGTRLEGLFTHAGHAYRATSRDEIRVIGEHEGRALVETAEMLFSRGLAVETLSVGSTPTAPYAAGISGVTEMRPGNYVFNDATQVALGGAAVDDCAQTVLTTVVGRPAPDRVVVDAGSKALPPENPSGRAAGWGIVSGHPELVVEGLSEEHGVIRAPAGPPGPPVGSRLRIVPNHACTATNLHPRSWLVDGPHVVEELPATARGWAPHTPAGA
jgi:D-serine deaminase-like pyridoxal phosphate-dependent protein